MKGLENTTPMQTSPYDKLPFPARSEQFSTDVYYGMSFARLGPDTIISRDLDEKIVNRLKDDQWILMGFAYSVVDNPFFDFLPFYTKCEYREHNAELGKKIFIMKMFSANYRSGTTLRIGTMHSIRYLLIRMVEFCKKKNLKLDNIFSSADYLKEFQGTLQPLVNRNLTSLIRTLNKIDSRDRGFELDGTILPYMQRIAKQLKYQGKQFPIIPSRILLLKYEQYQSYLDDFLKFFPQICDFLNKAAANPLYGRNLNAHVNPKAKGWNATAAQKRRHVASPIEFEDAIADNSLGEICKKYDWASAISVMGFVTLVSQCAKNLIHLFTLMRDHEVKSLSTDCLSSTRGWNNEALYVAGITTKLYSAKKPRQWITTDAILKPVEVLKKIQEILSPYVHNPQNYLLISTSAHPVSHCKLPKKGIVKQVSAESRLPPILIKEEDILELEAIEPLRNWRGDPRYQVGQPWRITSHQFRRTMAVFCAQTGLITLPSLKRLLGHLTTVMSLYYTKGCSAQNYHFNLINPRLAKELREAAFEADGAMFIREALRSEERLYGIKGSKIWEQRSNAVWLNVAVEETIDSVALGLSSYTETILGGCTSTVPCKRRAHGNYYGCASCRELVAKKSVMDETAEILEFDLRQLDPNSMEYRAEKQNLDDFIELRDRIIAKFS